MTLITVCTVIWVWRRPEQLVRPYVWDEESYVLRYYVHGDWFGVLKPLEGYLTLPTNVLVALAASISFVHLPILMYVFASLMFVATVLIIVVPDSRWGDWNTRAALAVGAALVPTNPEVSRVLLYCFWWSTLWPIAVLGWNRSLWLFRAPLLAIAALSSPAGGALSVLFGLSYLRGRQSRDFVSGAILLIGFIPQTILTITSSRSAMVWQVSGTALFRQVLRTAGYFEGAWLSMHYSAPLLLDVGGLVFLLYLMVASAVVSIRARSSEGLLLTVVAAMLTLLSAIPAPLISNPVSAGPRYYFLPFIVYAWTLIYVWRTSDLRSLRAACGALLLLSSLNLFVTFSRSSDTRTARLSWPNELQKCAQSVDPIFHVPIYFAGSSTTFWSPLDLTPAQCRRFLRSSQRRFDVDRALKAFTTP